MNRGCWGAGRVRGGVRVQACARRGPGQEAAPRTSVAGVAPGRRGQHRMGSRGPGSQRGTPGRVGDGEDWVGVPMVGVAAASLGWKLGRVVET